MFKNVKSSYEKERIPKTTQTHSLFSEMAEPILMKLYANESSSCPIRPYWFFFNRTITLPVMFKNVKSSYEKKHIPKNT